MAEAAVIFAASLTHAGTIHFSAIKHRTSVLIRSPFSPVSFPLRTSREAPAFDLIRVCSSGTPTAVKSRKKTTYPRKPIISDGSNAAEEGRLVCPGCGVFMQDSDPNLPGYYKKRATEERAVSGGLDVHIAESEEVLEEEGDVLSSSSDFDEEDISALDGDFEDDGFSTEDDGEQEEEGKTTEMWDESDWDSEWDLDDEEDDKLELDGFAPAGVGYGNITEEVLEKQKREKISKAERKKRAREARRAEVDATSTVCARCHSLRNYGQVKNPNVDNLIPDFDFDRLISTSLMKPTSTAPVVCTPRVVRRVASGGGLDRKRDPAMGVFTFVCRSSGGQWSAKQHGDGDIEASAASTYELQRKLVSAAAAVDSSGGVQSSFTLVTPSSGVFQVVIGGGGGGGFIGGGGSAAAAPAAGGASAAPEAPKAEEKKEEKEESDDDMGFSLFD